jgi:transposase
MPAARISTKKIETIFQFVQEGSIIFRRASRNLKISRQTLKKYIAHIKHFKNSYPEKSNDFKNYLNTCHKPTMRLGIGAERINLSSDSGLNLINAPSLIHLFPEIFEAISRNGSNRKIEWKKYRDVFSDGYGYSRFTELFSNWCTENRLVIKTQTWGIKEIPENDRRTFIKWKHSNDKGKWAKAVVFLESIKGVSKIKVIQKIESSRKQIKRWITAYKQSGMEGLTKKARRVNEVIKENIRLKKDNLIKLLHETPKLHGINRTTWGIKSLAEAYFKTYGIKIGTSTVSEYIRSQGYAFKYAKRTLTSPDPLYRGKLNKITEILANLKPNEKFFSVDEFGPCAIKLKGGRSLVHKDEIKTYPQWQKSKGCMILTAALELSENQVTHFFSDKKNTDEMIKLVEILIEKYTGQERIFFSWDAASWHASKKLYSRIKEINYKTYRKKNNTPFVALAPLPSSAQFLNVIESIFSGMAKAIIHNSNYQSTNECKSAIDLYFKERNEYFKANPKRAGNRIWRKEPVLPVFNEATIFKDPKWR